MKVENITKMIEEALKEAYKEIGNVNILIVGRSGVGKSTLINSIFQGNIAETGQGKPVTQTTRKITKEGIPITIWDTRGLEMAKFKETIKELEGLIIESAKKTDANEHIHVAWLCIHEDGRRVEDAEIELHNMLSQHIPVIGVITKARNDNGFRSEVQKLLPETKNIVRVRALKEELDEGQILQPMNLEKLVQLTAEVIPEGVRRALAAAQKADLQQKKSEAHKIVATSALLAGAAGATPIPFSDAIVLVPIQIGMLAKISSAFGLSLSEGFLSTIVATAAGATGATVIGRSLVSNLIKLVPGVGSLIGSAITATTASALTVTLGETYIATLMFLFTKAGGEVPDNETVQKEFQKQLSSHSS